MVIQYVDHIGFGAVSQGHFGGVYLPQIVRDLPLKPSVRCRADPPLRGQSLLFETYVGWPTGTAVAVLVLEPGPTRASLVAVHLRRVVVGLSCQLRCQLEDTLDGLVDIVAQHDHLRIGRPAEAVRMLDAALGADGAGVVEAYQQAWADLVDLERQAAELGGDHRALARERDFLAREAEEIEAAAFTDDEVEGLKAKADLLRNGHHLIESLGGAHEVRSGC